MTHHRHRAKTAFMSSVPKQNEEDECKKMRELLKRLDYRAQPSQLFYGLLMRAWMELEPDAWLL